MLGNGAAGCGEIEIRKTYNITGTAAITANILQVFGSVRVVNQYAVITEKTTLTNATGIYADAYDGTVAEDLTADGAVISGFAVGSLFFKDKDVTQVYTAMNADQVRVNELLLDNKAGKPFTVIQKNGVDTFIRFHLTTTDTPIDFDVEIVFLYEELGTGSRLKFL
jgi:hypothetical protein